MKQRQTYWLRASFAFLIFVVLGYVVKFYPEVLQPFDETIQTAVRGDLPDGLTFFFKTITVLGNTSTQVLVAALFVIIFAVKKWYAEASFLAVNGLLAAICIVSLKYLYQRPRPSISHLVYAGGYSFPSGHSMGSFLIVGSLLIISYQRIQHKVIKWTVVTLLALEIALVGFSRIYLGVHYPSDVLGGFVLGYAICNLLFPYYDQKRFEWRFTGKQK
ncbi:phosphatase PAP2 family protein [Streptococcus sp. zg-JUN1979]|uniref:phosphatase PAP2 family protein n=1 Tax=Streptococcus sp. zg-JUN1979 TaxID=3391450 RepID=UPI0039A683F7